MQNQHSPERQSPELYCTLASGAELDLNYYNTDVYIYQTPYDQVNHVYHHPESGSGYYIFNNQSLIESLRTQCFPTHVAPWPEAQDEAIFLQHSTASMDSELQGLLGE